MSNTMTKTELLDALQAEMGTTRPFYVEIRILDDFEYVKADLADTYQTVQRRLEAFDDDDDSGMNVSHISEGVTVTFLEYHHNGE